MILTDKIALVTGASRGIGLAIALELGKLGAVVVGTATNPENANRINAALQSLKIQGKGYVLDVSDVSAIDTVIAEISKDFSSPDILVNNAGITRDNLLLRMKNEEWQSVMKADLDSVFYLSRGCLKAMLKKKWGRIINISSVVAQTGNPGQANYCAAKAGIIGFTKSLASEVASRNITCNVVAPGFIRTAMTENLTDEQQKLILAKIPMNRMGNTEEIAHTVCFLASPLSGYITGETIHVNGGMLMS